MDRQTAISDLGDLVHVLNDDSGAVPETYLIGGRDEHGGALVAVAPSSVEDVQAVIRYAAEHDLRIVPQGARTGLVGGTVPEDKDASTTIIMSMERLKKQCSYNAADGRIVVDAGYTLSEVNDFLKPFGVCVAIDVSSDPMVGGMAATNIAGSRVVHYGDFRNMCAGIQVVFADADTSIYNTINKPAKDNAEVNFTSVFVGSFGTLGVITAVALKVYPIIEKTSTAWIPVASDVDLSDLLTSIKKYSGDSLLACEFISREAMAALADSPSQQQSKITIPYSDTDVIFVEWGNSAPNFDAEEFALEVLGSLSEQALIDDGQEVPAAKTWDLRHRLSEAVQHSGPKLIGCDISTTCERVGELREKCRDAVQVIDERLVTCDFGHLGDGGFHMNIVVPQEVFDEWKGQGVFDERIFDVRKAVSQVAVDLGGSYSAEHGRGATNYPLAKLHAGMGDVLAVGLQTVTNPRGILGHPGSQPIVTR